MGKKTCQKFIKITAIAMFVLMIAYVATTFITIDVADYDAQQTSSEFINGIVDGKVKLRNEDYALKKVTCTVSETNQEIDLASLSGSDTEMKNQLIDQMEYTVISKENRANGDEIINVMASSDKTFDLKWQSNNSPAKMMWFPKHPTAKDFLDKLKSDYYSASGVEYDINDVVLLPVILFVFGIAGAVLSVVFRKYGFFLIFPIFWSVIGILSYVLGFVGSTVPQFFIFSILNSFSSAVYAAQFALLIAVLILVVISIIFRAKLKKAIAAEEAEYVNSL